MMRKPRVEFEDVEFVEVIEDMAFAPLGQEVERYSGYIVDGIELSFRFVGYWLIVCPVAKLLRFLGKTLVWCLSLVVETILKFTLKAILFGVLIGFILLFVANGFSLGETFSFDGLETLRRAFK